jgi:DNA replication and repair protein RecF
MELKNIELKNYRNYKNLKLGFDNKKTLIIGENAQGKTNLLEAIFYLSSLESHRINKDAELIAFGEDYAQIKGTVQKGECEIDLEVIINPPKRKTMKVNSLKKTKSKDFLRVLSVVNFCVDDLLLLRGEPSHRRRWLDSAICQIYPAYSEKLAKYNKIRLQKANFLEQYSGNNDMLDVFNTQMATAGTNIIFLRMKFLKELEKIANQKHWEIARSENLTMQYSSSIYDGEAEQDKMTSGEIANMFAFKLEELKQDEIRRAMCLAGPHRDDISFFINNIDSKKFASQGQQRTVVLALKLAELDIIKEKNADTPLLLLDDVLAELDGGRQNFLLKAIESDVQTVITGVDVSAFDEKFLENVRIIKVKDGEIENG